MRALTCQRVPQKSARVAIFNTSPWRSWTLRSRALATPAAQVEATDELPLALEETVSDEMPDAAAELPRKIIEELRKAPEPPPRKGLLARLFT